MFLVSLTVSLSLIVGAAVGWWANSPGMDLLCSKPFVAELVEDVVAKGVTIAVSYTHLTLQTKA